MPTAAAATSAPFRSKHGWQRLARSPVAGIGRSPRTSSACRREPGGGCQKHGGPKMTARPSHTLRRRTLLFIVAFTGAAALTAVVTSSITSAQAAGATTFKATADTYIRSDQPDANFGAKYTLNAQA